MSGPRILLAGGGSAGHVSPLLATAVQISRHSPDSEVLVLGTADGLEVDLVPAAGYELLTIDKVPFPRRLSGTALRFPGRFATTLRAVRSLLRERRIDVVAGFGGYVCPPAYLTAAIARTPYVVHEANRRPGLANRLGARRATAVLTAFPGSSLPGARRIGMPMREAIAHLDRAARREEAVRGFGLDPARPVMLVTGGSLGAQRLNETVSAAAESFTEAGMQILHITGRGKTEGLIERPGYRIVDYVRAMEDAYAAADLALTRSGAGTVSELTAVGLPAVLVPLPIGNGEQALNARGLVAAEAAVLVRDEDFTADWVRRELIDLARDAGRLDRMSAAAGALGIRDADQAMARLVLTAAGGHR